METKNGKTPGTDNILEELRYTVFYSRASYFRDVREDDLFANIKRREYIDASHEYKTQWISTWSRNREIKTPRTKDGLQYFSLYHQD